MIDGTHITSPSRGFWAIAALLALAPVASYAQPTPELAPAVEEAEPDFATAFEHLDVETIPDPVIPEYAVDLATIEPAEPETVSLGRGVASYYGSRFAGRPTASGERFNPAMLTAAHRTLPFGSRVRVTNPRNGQTVVVRINDRGPFTKGRTIDLSRRAAENIGLIQAGHGTVELELLDS